MKTILFILSGLIAATCLGSQEVIDFWGNYDARKEPLNVEVVMQWETDMGYFQLVRYDLGKLVGTNTTASPKIAAYYGYPKNAKKVPGIVQLHGGGQRASKDRVADWVKMGYACISINWGAKILEDEESPNTNWDGLAAGFIRPGITKADKLDHHNPVSPDANTLYKEPHLLNSSWNLIAMSGRRALTFLEQRPEVDASKLGVEGHSMGGRSTVLTAIDPCVKAASPSVGGSGYLYEDLWGLPGSARRMTEEDGLELYRKTVSAQSYWPHITAPILFLGATNDFNSPTECVIKGMAQLPESTERMLVLAPHLNHRFTTDTVAARWMWMEAHLKGTFSFPKQSPSTLNLNTADHIPSFQVTVDDPAGLPIEKVEIFYGYARDPRIRFRRSAAVTQAGKVYTGACPVFDIAEPLFAFANITYKMSRTLPGRPGSAPTNLFTVSSQYQIALPDALSAAGVQATERQQRLIDDFSRGWQDWYRLGGDNPQHWFYATRKIIDPSWMGPKGGMLAFEIVTTEPGNSLAVGIEVNTWQGYTGRKKDSYFAIVELPAKGSNPIALKPSDFKNQGGASLTDWDEATELTFTAAWHVQGPQAAKDSWKGQCPTLQNLRWEGGEFITRPYPHQPRGKASSKTVAFEDEFQKAIDDSVTLEKLDAQTAADGKIYLTKEMASVTKSFWRVLNDKGVAGKPISVGGTVYERGLGVHAESELTFALNGKFTTFHVVPGPDDAHHGLIEMKILVDGKEVYASGKVRSTGYQAKPLDLPVTGAKTLTLIVDNADGNRGGDHASWAEAWLSSAISSNNQAKEQP